MNRKSIGNVSTSGSGPRAGNGEKKAGAENAPSGFRGKQMGFAFPGDQALLVFGESKWDLLSHGAVRLHFRVSGLRGTQMGFTFPWGFRIAFARSWPSGKANWVCFPVERLGLI